MVRKRILIVSRSFFPQNWPRAFRTTELAKEFARQGHFVNVIVPKSEIHYEFEKSHNIVITDLGKTKWRNLDIRGNGVALVLRKAINRLANWLFEFPNIELVWMVSKSLKNLRNYDLLISIAYPYTIHWGVAKAWNYKNRIAKTWVADCGDPYIQNDNDRMKPPFYLGLVERWFLRKVDYVTVPNDVAIQYYYPEFRNKIRIIPQGFRFEDINVYAGDIPNDKVIFGYAGMFIPGVRDPSEFLQFLNSLDSSYRFEFHVYTHHPKVVEPYISSSNGRIKLMGVKPREIVLYELSKMHFVVNIENANGNQSPSKLIDYAIIKKPVLNIRYGSLNKEVVLQFLNQDFSNQKALPDSDIYRIENIVAAFIALIEE